MNLRRLPKSRAHKGPFLIVAALAMLSCAPARAQFFGGTFLSRGTALPSTCRLGDLYYKTTAPIGLYSCTATNTWTIPAGGSTAPYSCPVSAVSSIACTHNLGTSTPWVACYDGSGNMLGSAGTLAYVSSVVATSANVATITFSDTATATCVISTGSMGPTGATGATGPTGPAGGGATIATTSGALKGDGAGNGLAVTGSASDCVHVDGSSASCGSTSGAGGFLVFQAASFNPADAATYWFGGSGNASASGRGYASPITGAIKSATVRTYAGGAAGTTETSTITVTVNGSDVATISAAVIVDATHTYTVTGLNVAVTLGDLVEMKWVCPTWATNPTTVSVYGSISIQ